MSANSANIFWQTWALSFFACFCESAILAVSAKSFWPTRALLKTTDFSEATEITEIAVSTFGMGGDLGGLRASKSWRDYEMARNDSHALFKARHPGSVRLNFQRALGRERPNCGEIFMCTLQDWVANFNKKTGVAEIFRDARA